MELFEEVKNNRVGFPNTYPELVIQNEAFQANQNKHQNHNGSQSFQNFQNYNQNYETFELYEVKQETNGTRITQTNGIRTITQNPIVKQQIDE